MKRSAPLSAIPAFTLLLYLTVSEPPAVWLLFLSAIAFHEWGHLFLFATLGIPAPAFGLSGLGARLSPTLPLLPREEAAVALAGPLFNILFALLALRFGKGGFFLLSAAVHLLFGLGNLLPFGGCDGERLLRLFLRRFFPARAEAILRFFAVLFLALFFYLSLFLYYLTGNGLAGVLFALYFIFRPLSEA